MWAFGVEPHDPFRGRQFDLADVTPRALAADEFVLERPDGGLGQRVIQRVADRADRGIHALAEEPLGERHRPVLAARAAVRYQSVQAGGAVLGAGEEGMFDGIEDQVGGHRSGGPPAVPVVFASTAKSANRAGGRPRVANMGRGIERVMSEVSLRAARIRQLAVAALADRPSLPCIQLPDAFGKCCQSFGEELDNGVLGSPGDLAELVARGRGPWAALLISGHHIGCHRQVEAVLPARGLNRQDLTARISRLTRVADASMPGSGLAETSSAGRRNCRRRKRYEEIPPLLAWHRRSDRSAAREREKDTSRFGKCACSPTRS
jgi:hypothetical protein